MNGLLPYSHLGSLLEAFFESSHHVESGLWVLISTSLKELSETFDGVGEFDESSWHTREHFRHLERLRKESLDFSSSGDGKSILFGQLVHTQNSDDILEGLVVLDQLLDSSCGIVVSLTNDGWVKHSRGGVERIHSWINTQLSKSSGQHSSGIQMCECSGWSWIGQIISRHVDSLHRGD